MQPIDQSTSSAGQSNPPPVASAERVVEASVLSYAVPDIISARSLVFCCVIAWMYLLLLVGAAWAIVQYRVETVLFTGPIAGVIGIASLFAALRARHRIAITLAAAQCAVPFIAFGTIYSFEIGPRAAHWPLATSALAAALALLPLTIGLQRAQLRIGLATPA